MQSFGGEGFALWPNWGNSKKAQNLPAPFYYPHFDKAWELVTGPAQKQYTKKILATTLWLVSFSLAW